MFTACLQLLLLYIYYLNFTCSYSTVTILVDILIIVCVLIGYVQEIKGKLFNTSRVELKNVVDKYSAKVPPSLSSQFKDRVN